MSDTPSNVGRYIYIYMLIYHIRVPSSEAMTKSRIRSFVLTIVHMSNIPRKGQHKFMDEASSSFCWCCSKGHQNENEVQLLDSEPLAEIGDIKWPTIKDCQTWWTSLTRGFMCTNYLPRQNIMPSPSNMRKPSAGSSSNTLHILVAINNKSWLQQVVKPFYRFSCSLFPSEKW